MRFLNLTHPCDITIFQIFSNITLILAESFKFFIRHLLLCAVEVSGRMGYLD